jgi:hypothetical protein
MVKTRVKLGKYEAWIVVENQEIEHYEVEVNEESKVATCWIASTAGKVVSIRFIQSLSLYLIGLSILVFGLKNTIMILIVGLSFPWMVVSSLKLLFVPSQD